MNNSASFPTYYDILGVDRTADAKAIRQAYLRASLKYHPDKNLSHIEESKARFIDIGKAYDVLKDPVQRANYDEELRRRPNDLEGTLVQYLGQNLGVNGKTWIAVPGNNGKRYQVLVAVKEVAADQNYLPTQEVANWQN